MLCSFLFWTVLYPANIKSSGALPPDPSLGLGHGTTAKAAVPPDSHLDCRMILWSFSRNTTFENSVFIQKQTLVKPSKHINVRISDETTLIVNVYQRCFNADIWLKMKVELTYIYRRCFNVGKTRLIELRRWTNFVSTLKFSWKWKLSRRMFIVVVSTLTKHKLKFTCSNSTIETLEKHVKHVQS